MTQGILNSVYRWVHRQDVGRSYRYPSVGKGWVVLFALWLALVPTAHADDALLARLHEPGTALLLRHALAPGVGDPPGFQLEDCSTQRNLSEEGRAQAQKIGERLRAAGIDEARVYSSRWCRCLETAERLALGPVIPDPVLDSFFQQPADGPARTTALRERLQTLTPGLPVVLVTHQVNVSALTGQFTRSGQGAEVQIQPHGEIAILGLLQ